MNKKSIAKILTMLSKYLNVLLTFFYFYEKTEKFMFIEP